MQRIPDDESATAQPANHALAEKFVRRDGVRWNKPIWPVALCFRIVIQIAERNRWSMASTLADPIQIMATTSHLDPKAVHAGIHTVYNVSIS
ncbi:hypothetical protein [uncultured Nitrosomonas sp.]|uniref:hypothetical protein n=1 Tax=uncultured Nitrosomonas sp. TaxID=156424 RepID=UPI0025CBFA4C|nr:hypothetical protein [uncultured Nitrosomonas sp.]